MIDEQLQGLISITPATLTEATIGVYALAAATSIWVIIKIGAGKGWARTSLVINFVLDFLWCAAPPYHGAWELLTYVPDLGLQSYALYLLYTWPGERWFNQQAHTNS